MIELTSPQILTLIGVLLFILIGLLFFVARRTRDVQELRQDLNKSHQDFNQLAARFDALTQIRLTERDEKIAYLSQELDEEQLRNAQIGSQISALKERFGIASAQAESLQNQLQQSQNQLVRKEQEQQQLTEKLTTLTQELTGLKTRLAEKEKHFAEQQQAIEQSKQQLGTEFQNLANRILEEKSRSFNQTNQTALETLLKPFREQIEGFQKRVNEIHSEALKGNAGLEAEIKKVLQGQSFEHRIEGRKENARQLGRNATRARLTIGGLNRKRALPRAGAF